MAATNNLQPYVGGRPHEQATKREESILRKKLQFHFMNPCQKWREKRRFPWKLLLQLGKILVVTVQVVLFGFSRSSHVDFLNKTNIAFRHLYLHGWVSTYETLPYPPSTGAFAVYTINDFYQAINFAMRQFNETEKLAIGAYHFSTANNTKEPMVMCKTHYKNGHIWAFNQSFLFDSEQVTECFKLHPVRVCNESNVNNTLPNCEHDYNVEEFLRLRNQSINFDRIITVTLNFKLTSVHLKSLSYMDPPDCYLFNVVITFDNVEHNGRFVIDLTSVENYLTCDGDITYYTSSPVVAIIVFDVFVILISFLSLALCSRSLYRTYFLQRETSSFFSRHFGTPLSLEDKLEFLNMWYILIIVNDVMTILGTIYKLEIENKNVANYEGCGILLGTANLFVWFGVLRYLNFFAEFNILIVTMKKAAPKVLRFLVCATVMYLGFTVCGWVILGPYHLKFRQISTASECLFALVNGDELFITFSAITANNNVFIWWYSRLYLYSFISLFIYIVLSLFISVIMDTYETIKDYYQSGGLPKGDLRQFIETSDAEDVSDIELLLSENTSLESRLCTCPSFDLGRLASLCNCCDRLKSSLVTRRTRLRTNSDSSLLDNSHLVS